MILYIVWLRPIVNCGRAFWPPPSAKAKAGSIIAAEWVFEGGFAHMIRFSCDLRSAYHSNDVHPTGIATISARTPFHLNTYHLHT